MIKKIILLLAFLTIPFTEKADDIKLINLRNLYYKALVNKEDSEKFTQTTEKITGIDKKLLTGYLGVSWMIKANHAINPTYKLSYFLKGKAILESAINSDSKNIELLFLRYCVQTNTPSFLNYNHNIQSDKNSITSQFALITDLDLKKRIKEFMLQSKYCTVLDKKKFV